jgi:hypothetical protein
VSKVAFRKGGLFPSSGLRLETKCFFLAEPYKRAGLKHLSPKGVSQAEGHSSWRQLSSTSCSRILSLPTYDDYTDPVFEALCSKQAKTLGSIQMNDTALIRMCLHENIQKKFGFSM